MVVAGLMCSAGGVIRETYVNILFENLQARWGIILKWTLNKQIFKYTNLYVNTINSMYYLTSSFEVSFSILKPVT
jgi:hypothetical protein